VQLLRCDPGLGDGLSEQARAAAAEALLVRTTLLAKGPWRPALECPEPGHLGYLVVDGLLVRRVEVAGGSGVELLGRGDLLRPWQEDASSFCAASWEILEPIALVPLGPRLAHSLGQWPPILSNIVGRGVRRSRVLAAGAAVASLTGLQERLLILFWQLAERWGELGKDGIQISIRLPHRLLAELVGARRPSVTSALGELQRGGHLTTGRHGCWLLHGDPPC
jgi:CRP/FNR family transcriptional regulator, cyclic AMP receptor protein